MRKIIFIILLVAASVAAIAMPHKHKRKAGIDNHILSVSMRRTACYGRCPDYTVTINKDGTVTYYGRLFTDTGTFTKSLGYKKGQEIINEFYEYRVDTCSDVYEKRIADLPGVIFTVRYKTHTKTISNANFGPVFFTRLATDMDNAGKKTDDTGWQKVPHPVK